MKCKSCCTVFCIGSTGERETDGGNQSNRTCRKRNIIPVAGPQIRSRHGTGCGRRRRESSGAVTIPAVWRELRRGRSFRRKGDFSAFGRHGGERMRFRRGGRRVGIFPGGTTAVHRRPRPGKSSSGGRRSSRPVFTSQVNPR